MSACDARAIESGVPGQELMQRAGQAMFHCFAAQARARGLHGAWSILCGPGNNGGDGFVIARMCVEHDIPLSIILAADRALSSDAKLMLDQVHGKAVRIFSLTESDLAEQATERQVVEILASSSVVLDALLGTGQSRAPKAAIEKALLCVTRAKQLARTPQLFGAVDIPSGINASSGETFEPHFQADITVTVEAPKRGMLQYPARAICGEIQAVTIGIDCAGLVKYHLLDEDTCPRLAARKADSHKGIFGPLLVVGGSAAMPGAPVLSAHAALRAGAGLVRLARPSRCAQAGLEPAWPEVMPLEVASAKEFSVSDIPALKSFCQEAKAMVLGPGIGLTAKTRKFVEKLLALSARSQCSVVVDADALAVLPALKKVTLDHCIFTPHPGEMARLLGISSAQVQADRFSAIESAQRRFGGVWLLKGAGTLIVAPGVAALSCAGTPWMSTAGSGDVLAGLIAGLCAQGLSSVEAAKAGVFLHGRAGERCRDLHNGPIIASDLIAQLPALVAEYVG